MASIFTKICQGQIPCYRVAETDECLAFLDISPIAKGHVLVIPKKEVDNIFDLDDTTFLQLHLFSKRVAIALRKVIPCVKVGVAVIGIDVPHAHIHLVPIHDVGDLNFAKERICLNEQQLIDLAAEIGAAMNT